MSPSAGIQRLLTQEARLLEESTTPKPTPQTLPKLLFKCKFFSKLHIIFALQSTVAGTTSI